LKTPRFVVREVSEDEDFGEFFVATEDDLFSFFDGATVEAAFDADGKPA
jgi:hypothetical protein